MTDDLIYYLEQLTRSDLLEVVIVIFVLLAWWCGNQIRRSIRMLNGDSPTTQVEPRPRRRLPLH